jgi:hypothetical protein
MQTPEANLSQGMRQVKGVYTQRMNRRHGHVGHVFQGRFKAILVERECNLLELARYAVLNPVRAGLVGDVEAWPWSTYRAMTGAEPAVPWLETDGLLQQFGRQHGRAVAAYIELADHTHARWR